VVAAPRNLLRRERVIGIISSWDIRRRDSEGYSLLMTDSRVVGSNRPDLTDNFWAYLPPGREPDPLVAQGVAREADRIVAKKDFELQRDKMVKIVYYSPGLLSGGRLLFVTVGRKVEIGITVLSAWNPGILTTVSTLVSSLLIFSPEGFYDEKTGARVRDEGALPE
jgi:hypothetical protein